MKSGWYGIPALVRSLVVARGCGKRGPKKRYIRRSIRHAHAANFLARTEPHRYTNPPQFEAETTQGVTDMSRQIKSLTLADARQIIAAGEKKAQELGIPYNIAVVDAGGGLISHVRMDGAWLGSVDISISKAWTSRAFDMSTEAVAGATQSGQSLFGLNTTNQGKAVIFGGGEPVKEGDTVVGAVGASGGSVENDIKVVQAAVAGYKSGK
jgi:uncharacterized protein GlcG (DUF336 family)